MSTHRDDEIRSGVLLEEHGVLTYRFLVLVRGYNDFIVASRRKLTAYAVAQGDKADPGVKVRGLTFQSSCLSWVCCYGGGLGGKV